MTTRSLIACFGVVAFAACAALAQAQTAQFVTPQLEPLPVAVDLDRDPLYMAQAPLDPAMPPWSLPTQPGSGYAFSREPYQPYPDSITLDAPEIRKPAGRDGMLQKFTFLNSFLPKIGPNGQNNEDIEINALLGIPFPSRESPILLKPGFEWHQWWGLADNLLPSDLYDAYLDILWLHNWSEAFQTIIGASPGWHGDWQSAEEEALRVQVLGLINYTFSPTLKMVLGAKYLDRTDVAFLPIAGFVWTPDECREYSLVFPQPKISYRVYATPYDEYWAAIGGEIGGGVWGVELGTGALDVINTRDYRVYLGLDYKVVGGWTSRLELGYVFGRVIEFQSGLPDIKPADTMLIRFGLIY